MKAIKKPISSRLSNTMRTPHGFVWCGEDMKNIPLIRTPDGMIFEPALRYFADGWLHRRFKSKSSMLPVMYTLRDWLAFLTRRGVAWCEVEDMTMREYRLYLETLVEQGSFSRSRVALKLEHVFNFYADLPRAMPFLNRAPMPSFVGVVGTTAPISAVKLKNGKFRWSGADIIKSAAPKRPTPDKLDVERIEEHLRTHAFGSVALNWHEQRQVLLRERNWLIARCQARAGLRRSEVANLSLQQIYASLLKQGIINVRPNHGEPTNPVAFACDNEDMQAKILQRIDVYKNRGYKTLNVTVRQKGGGDRSVEFPIDLIVDILEIAVWKFRKHLSTRSHTGAVPINKHTIFFSFRRLGEPLKEGSVGDIVNDAFRELGIAGSGHRLRAYYLTHMAWLLWNENLALNGYRNGVSVETQTLNRLAELAGHAQPGTVERNYLDIAQLLHASRQNRPKLDAASEALNALRLACPVLPAQDLRRIERVILALKNKENLMVRAMLDAVIERHGSPPITNVKAKTDHLRVIGKEKS